MSEVYLKSNILLLYINHTDKKLVGCIYKQVLNSFEAYCIGYQYAPFFLMCDILQMSIYALKKKNLYEDCPLNTQN